MEAYLSMVAEKVGRYKPFEISTTGPDAIYIRIASISLRTGIRSGIEILVAYFLSR
jgi:hypothetical protein